MDTMKPREEDVSQLADHYLLESGDFGPKSAPRWKNSDPKSPETYSQMILGLNELTFFF